MEKNTYPVEEKVQIFFLSAEITNLRFSMIRTMEKKKKKPQQVTDTAFKNGCVCRRRRTIVKMVDGGQER